MTKRIPKPQPDRDLLVANLRRLEPVLRREGVTALALFGSRARGDHRPDSDIDLLIDVDSGRKFSLLDLIGVAHEVEDSTALQADVVMRRSLDATTRRDVALEEVAIF